MNRTAMEAREERWSCGESPELTAGSTTREPGRQAREALALALAEIRLSQGRLGPRLS